MAARWLTIDDLPVLNPAVQAHAAARLNTPVDFWKRANSFCCQRGQEPGSAWLLLGRATVDALNRNGWHELHWCSEYGDLIARSLIMVSAMCMSKDGDSKAPYLVEFQDKRRLLKFSSIEALYNVRIPAPPNTTDVYYPESLDDGDPWTWATLFADLWASLPAVAGAAPALPYSPDGVPEQLRFVGVSAWEAINTVLTAIGCEVAYNPIADTFSVVRAGATQAGVVASETTFRNRLTYDYLPKQDLNLATLPETIRVYFRRKESYFGIERDVKYENNWEMDPATYIDLATGATGVQAGTIKILWDSLPARTDANGNILNTSDLTSRANEVAQNWFDLIERGDERYQKHYAGLVTSILPGSEVREVIWRDYGDGQGLLTEIHKRPATSEAKAGSPVRESYCPPDLGRFTHPTYPHVAQVVQVYDSGESTGVDLQPNAEGLFPGVVRSWAEGTLRTWDDCWVRIMDLTDANALDGAHVVKNGDCFLGRLSGLEQGTLDAATVYRPIYLARKGKSPNVPFMGVAQSNIDGYRHGKGTASSAGHKFSKGFYRPFGIELTDPEDPDVSDECADIGDSGSAVEAYNIARHQQATGTAAWLWPDRNGKWLALPMPSKPIQLVVRGSTSTLTTSTASITKWSIITTGFKEISFGDLGVAYTGGGNDDVRLKYSPGANTGRWDVEFRWSYGVTPGNAVTQSPNLFRLFFSSVFLTGSRYTPPVIQRGTTTANSQSILNLDGVTRDCVIGLQEGNLLGAIDFQLEGWTTGTTWWVDYELVLRPSQPDNHALLVGI